MTVAAATATAATALEMGRWSIVSSDDNTLNISFDGNEAINAPSGESFSYEIPKGDARVYRITKAVASVGDIVADTAESNTLSAVIAAGQCVVAATRDIDSVGLYDLSGRCVARVDGIGHVQAVFDIDLRPGVYIVAADMVGGDRLTSKVTAK